MYYPATTSSQRKVLFETWEETENVREACQKARVSERTFYYWKSRFEKGGYEGLEKAKQAGRPKGSRVAEEIKEKVIKLKGAEPKWGKERIEQELSKRNSWVPLVSAKTVKQILAEAGLWPQAVEKGQKKRG